MQSGQANPTQAPVQGGKAKQFAGVTLNVSMFTAPYTNALADYIPEFEEQTGMKVNYESPAFAVYNQRTDLELSQKGSAYDVLTLTFIYSGRWIGAGWFTPLDDFLNDPNKTPADWDPKDFLAGGMKNMLDKNGKIYSFPWWTEPLIAAASRYDLIQQAGMTMPETFDDLVKMSAAVDDKEGVKAFVIENHYGWSWIPILQGFGGTIFKGPPDDLMPTLDTPEVAEAADFVANLIKKYSPAAALSFTSDTALNALQQGRANYSMANSQQMILLADASKSKVTKTVGFGMVPAGPKGRFPQVASHGMGIPLGARQKDASWEFIKWAMGKDLLSRMLVKNSYGGAPRQSVLGGPDFKKVMTINGFDVAKSFLDSISRAEAGYMTYRTVSVYPQVDQQLNTLVQNVVSGQMSAKDACRNAQEQSIAELKKAGINL
ncbi:MAG: extracellular solute-binding protein [Dehalococcoidales bacterium]|nr:extracellular solute-binding protein [Dehalococcoidales bacterium]